MTNMRPLIALNGGINMPADAFSRAVAFAVSQPDDMDVNEILFRPTVQML